MSNFPPDSYPPQDLPPGGYPPGPYYGGQSPPPPGDVSGRVVPPAIGLIVVALLNLLIGLYFIVSGALSSALPDDQFQQQMANLNQTQRDALDKAGYSVESLKKATLIFGVGGGGLAVFLSMLTFLGAVRMLALKSYGLAVFVSVLAAIPCVSCVGCCGIGEAVGIWALVVLLNPEVRAAFR